MPEPDAAHGQAEHRCRLVERHEISAPVDDEQPDISHYREAVAAMFDQARAWHAAHGLEPIDLARFARTASANGQAAVGVQWTVTVGRGDISADQRLPGVMDSWKWSARFHHWRKVFNRMDGRQGRLLALREDGRASVTPLFRDHRSGQLTGHEPVVGVRTGVVNGCTCHIGGPFKDICPVHFEADT
ncbi:hypothetical protein FDI64_gp68 [Mycobacterium phage Zemanar]|uniref:Uncharacterized protein n=2 Tax=Coopervirus TaxID=1982898 RepID=A0A7G8LFW0_9CAUD|nr:hypothetical protein FDI64_gp68 [Mycobacterium phage Zemanar]YP_010109611.1 hypothetical protein KNV18_gp68 [Mycobacterium phage Heath]AEJ95742.1 hypothetical protein ZEMANAR_68 [Mycobacterium phage Zemanar]QNJ56132.1 hypothetical protein SEA_HEATH_68 [Mycobacterium phage Heath]